LLSSSGLLVSEQEGAQAVAKRKASLAKDKKSSKRLRAGNLILDLDARCVIKSGEAMHLTFKECALLNLFMSNGGEVMTRKRLMKEVWQTDYLGDTRTLDVHIHWLRKKIEDDPSSPTLLRTVRAVGYRLEVPKRRK
jgi:two-component system alkaline phosphatase synthesis response regulator PhoP